LPPLRPARAPNRHRRPQHPLLPPLPKIALPRREQDQEPRGNSFSGARDNREGVARRRGSGLSGDAHDLPPDCPGGKEGLINYEKKIRRLRQYRLRAAAWHGRRHLKFSLSYLFPSSPPW
jgi:hypothetical protein